MDKPIDSLERLRISNKQRPTSRNRNGLLIAIIVIVVAGVGVGAAWWYYQTTGVNIVASMTQKPVAVRTYVIPRQQADAGGDVVLVANGRIVSDVRVYVATKVSGQITALDVEQGDYVEKDQVLARIEVDVYEAQRDEAQATVERLTHAVERAQADHLGQQATIADAQADYDWRKYNLERLQALEVRDRASDVEFVEAQHIFERAQAALALAKASEQSARTAIEVTRAELRSAESVLRLWQKRLDDCEIRAPISGVVLERNAQIGDFLAAEGGRGANANAQLVSIADMTRLRVEIDVSERDIHRVHPNQEARITPDAYQSSAHRGEVMWIDPVGDYARAVVQVKVRIKDPSPQLRIEASAKVEFLSPKAEPSATQSADGRSANFWVPLDAVKIPVDGSDPLVFTVIDDRAVANRITIGSRTNKLVEVTTGVYAGMEIISSQLDKLEDQTPVLIQPALPPT